MYKHPHLILDSFSPLSSKALRTTEQYFGSFSLRQRGAPRVACPFIRQNLVLFSACGEEIEPQCFEKELREVRNVTFISAQQNYDHMI